jgi:hypothetical protein
VLRRIHANRQSARRFHDRFALIAVSAEARQKLQGYVAASASVTFSNSTHGHGWRFAAAQS